MCGAFLDASCGLAVYRIVVAVMWVYRDGVWFGFITSALLLAVVLCWVDRYFCSWVLLGSFCLLRAPLGWICGRCICSAEVWLCAGLALLCLLRRLVVMWIGLISLSPTYSLQLSSAGMIIVSVRTFCEAVVCRLLCATPAWIALPTIPTRNGGSTY